MVPGYLVSVGVGLEGLTNGIQLKVVLSNRLAMEWISLSHVFSHGTDLY